MLSAHITRMSSSIRWAFNWKEWDPSVQVLEEATSCLQNDEREKLQNFVFRKDIRASLIGRLLMRKFVNEYTDIPYNRITFIRDENYKPVLKDKSVIIDFNVSHHGSYTVLAGEVKNVKVGVDIMVLDYNKDRNLTHFFRLMKRQFSEAEWEEIRSGKSNAEQLYMFNRHWALKESYTKAIGTGVSTDLRTLDFRTNSKLTEDSIITDTVLFINGIKQNWLFEESLLDSQHCVTVALQKNDNSLQLHNTRFRIMNYDELMLHAVPLCPIDSQFITRYFMKSEQPF
ncbi:PREDICTED: L-aminoadipate-semialdehyde dehydrogenase-phosphopantetheinyl transferase [Cyphomyrmex costatus]|uniref:L-aminoadipate-semialdehyde dehydrogenase-phosphopantetheinyl transferase n=1 Tax=Cyphomyrmex costatus TaxID=456900 RepID=UPI00085236FD|nr:PREDICTED: L-aminoadipate-semialdehyde dehydrogenase-phosphopantetheinyl transferase [Cyphomyrmex costatus]